jgi:hypothetical protein
MLLLNCRRRGVLFMGESFLCCGGTRADATTATVKADVRIVHDDCLLINVVDDVHIHIIHTGVVEEVAAGPITAGIARADVTETVVDAAVETDFRSPVARIP